MEKADDILEELGMAGGAATAVPRAAAATIAREVALLDALGGDSIDVDTLAARTAMSPELVVAALTNLELAGQVAALPGGLWQRLHRG